MTSFRFAHAGVSADGPIREWRGWQELAARCANDLGEGAGGVGLFYVTEPLAGELDAIAARLRETSGVREWIGAVGPAICAAATDYFETPAMAAIVLDLPEATYTILSGVAAGGATQQALGAAEEWAQANNAHFAIVHADPRGPGMGTLIPALAYATNAYLVGALTSSTTDAAQFAGAPVGGGLSGLMLAEQVPVTTGLTQGCTPIGPAHEITGMERELVSELDGRPALDVLKDDVGELLARDLRRVAGYIHAALPVTGSDTGDYMVRNLVGIDQGRGWIAVAAELALGERLMFVRRDAVSAVEDMERMLGQLKARAGGRVRGAVYHSCVARGPHQFGPGAVEMSMIREAFGEVPVIGMFGNGEISNDRLYTYTGILSVFVDGAGAEAGAPR